MQRRRLLELFAIGVAAATARLAGARSSDRPPIRCFVAGVQYQSIDVFRLVRGRRVLLLESSYREETCYEVLTMEGARIGFVPRSMVSLVTERGFSAAWLETIQPHAVPWKQVEIAIVPGSA